jgi:hypothetical protein
VVTDDNYITDVSTAQTALNGVYASWRSTGVSYLRYGMSSMAHTQTQAMVAQIFLAVNFNFLIDSNSIRSHFFSSHKSLSMHFLSSFVLSQFSEIVPYQHGIFAICSLRMLLAH